MPLDDRDYIRGQHPSTCTCTECVKKRLKRLKGFGKPMRPMKHIYGKTKHSKFFKGITRLSLNLLVLAGLGMLIRHSYLLFTHKLSALSGSITLIVGIIIWIVLIKLLRGRYKWIKPSFKLTTSSVIIILLIFAFAGVPPMSTYKNNLVESWNTALTEWEEEREQAEAEREKESPESYGVLQFNTFTDKSTGFSVEYPESWTFSIINMEDEGVTDVSFEGTISQDSGILCSLLISYDPTFTDARGLWTSMVNLAGGSLTGKKSSTTIGELQGYELTQEISGKNSRIFVSDWKSGVLLAIRSYPIDILTPSEINKLNNYLERLIASASVMEPPTPTPTTPPKVTPAIQTIESVEKEAFNLINQERIKAGLQPTVWDNELYKLSKAHTQEMANRGELFHTPMGAVHGENVWGASYGGFDRSLLAIVIVNNWMSSPLHRAWILHAPIKESVVSIVDDQRGQFASWSFWMYKLTSGPELVERIAKEWRDSGSNLPWIEWLISKGYLKP